MNDAAKQIANSEPATAHDVHDEAAATGMTPGAGAPADDDALLGDSQEALERSSE